MSIGHRIRAAARAFHEAEQSHKYAERAGYDMSPLEHIAADKAWKGACSSWDIELLTLDKMQDDLERLQALIQESAR